MFTGYVRELIGDLGGNGWIVVIRIVTTTSIIEMFGWCLVGCDDRNL